MALQNVNNAFECKTAQKYDETSAQKPARNKQHMGRPYAIFRDDCTERGSRIKPLRFAPTAGRRAEKTRGLDPSPSPLLPCLR